MALKRPTTFQINRSCFENEIHFLKQALLVIQIVMIAVALMSVGLILTGAWLTHWLVKSGPVKYWVHKGLWGRFQIATMSVQSLIVVVYQ